jgi:hypothetical protein
MGSDPKIWFGSRAAARLAVGLGLVVWSAGCTAGGAESERADDPEASAANAEGNSAPASRDAPADESPEPPEALRTEAREIAKRYMMGLKGKLQAAMQDKGPAGALDVCSEAAPGIAGKLSQEAGWAVGRTSLKVRNPRNAPSVEERAVLMRFEARAAAGEPVEALEHAGVLEIGGDRYLHYMKAIPTGGICLTCHGNSLPPEVAEAVDRVYPSDAATGFEEGDLRGAFTFVKPL